MIYVQYDKNMLLKVSDGFFFRKHHIPMIVNSGIFLTSLILFLVGFLKDKSLFLPATIIISFSALIYILLGVAYFVILSRLSKEYKDDAGNYCELAFDVTGQDLIISCDKKIYYQAPITDLRRIVFLAGSLIIRFKHFPEVILPNVKEMRDFVNERIKPLKPKKL